MSISDNNILTEEEFNDLSEYVSAIETRKLGVITADQRRLVKTYNYVRTLQRRNTQLGIAVADAEKREEYARHDGWETGVKTAAMAVFEQMGTDELVPAPTNPFEGRPE